MAEWLEAARRRVLDECKAGEWGLKGALGRGVKALGAWKGAWALRREGFRRGVRSGVGRGGAGCGKRGRVGDKKEGRFPEVPRIRLRRGGTEGRRWWKVL